VNAILCIFASLPPNHRRLLMYSESLHFVSLIYMDLPTRLEKRMHAIHFAVGYFFLCISLITSTFSFIINGLLSTQVDKSRWKQTNIKLYN
jgi:hypothetical protein